MPGTANVTVGNPYPTIESEKKLYFAEGKEILAIKIARKTIHLQKFNSESLSIGTLKIYDDMPRGSTIEKVTKLKNKYFLFYSLWDGEHQNLLYREINFKEGTFMSLGENIFKTKGKIGGGRLPDRDFPFNRFNFSFSVDSTKVLIHGRKPSDINNDSKSFDVISMQVYDENLKMLWNQEVEMPYSERKMDALSYSVDSKSNVQIVAKIYNNAPASELGIERKQNYRIEILNIEAGKTTVSKTLIGSVSKFVKGTSLYEHPGGYIMGAGFYNMGNINNDNTDGIIVFKLSPEGRMYDDTTYEIPLEIINLYAKSKDGQRERFEDLDLNSIYIQKDESVLLISEQKTFSQGGSYPIYTGSPYGSGMASSSKPPEYSYNDIVVTKIDGSGKLVWMRRLPKKQKSENEALTFHYAKIQGKHHFLFVDNSRNKDLPAAKKPVGHTIGEAGVLTAYSIEDSNGEVSKITFFDTRNVNGVLVYQLAQSRIVRTSENEFVSEAYKRDEGDILIKVKMED